MNFFTTLLNDGFFNLHSRFSISLTLLRLPERGADSGVAGSAVPRGDGPLEGSRLHLLDDGVDENRRRTANAKSLGLAATKRGASYGTV